MDQCITKWMLHVYTMDNGQVFYTLF